MRKIFFDLDGPIMDVKKRYFFTTLKILRSLNISNKLNLNSYWRLKRNLKFDLYLEKKLTKNQINEFKFRFKNEIESKTVVLDSLQSGIMKIIKKLKKENLIILITLRQNKLLCIKLLKKLNLYDLFDRIHVLSFKNKKLYAKRLILAKYKISKRDIMIGDSEYDIYAAKKTGIKTVAVSYGIRNKEILKAYKPTYIIQRSSELLKILK